MQSPTIFMAYYEPDPTCGGLIEVLRRNGIEAAVIPGQECRPDEIPDFVVASDKVTYYVLVAAANTEKAHQIAQDHKHPNLPKKLF